MSDTLKKLTAERNELVYKFKLLTSDLKEYINHPVETVCILSIRNQIDFCLIDIKRLDFLIGVEMSHQLKDKLSQLYNQAFTKQNEKNNVFTVADLPKISQSLFDQPFI